MTITTLSTPFDALRVGDQFATSSRTITEEDVQRFAELTGDDHPQHTDAAWAASSLFGERVAHGLLVFSCAAGLVPFDHERVVALRAVRDLVFKAPVRLGGSIRVEGRVTSTTPLDERAGLVGVALRVREKGGQLIARAALEVIWKRTLEQRDAAVDEQMEGS
jgi:3-hydroxybutyryl-CoA dehydratase